MKTFYRLMGILSVFNMVVNIYQGSYLLALISFACFLVSAIQVLSLVREEILDDYITLKELIEREDI